MINSPKSKVKRFNWILLLVSGLGLILFVIISLNRGVSQTPSASILNIGNQTAGFSFAESPRVWSFPDDLGPHPDYQTEWWYYTGNLKNENGYRFGYQLTFFRKALIPEQAKLERPSAWSADQVYMAHFALSDIRENEHYAFERFSRNALGLAGAVSEPFEVWLEDWQVIQISADKYQLSAKQDQLQVDLILEDLKGPVFHGDQGYSQKGPTPSDASYYFSQTHLLTNGVIKNQEKIFNVNGFSWMDHEFSTSALSEGQVGWDWFSIQLLDGWEIMLFQIRREDGTIDSHSSGTLIEKDGGTEHLTNNDFIIEILEKWRSPNSGVEYPSRWRVKIPARQVILEIHPSFDDQEMNLSYNYWEGSVVINGSVEGAAIQGSGYVEMTGYVDSFKGDL